MSTKLKLTINTKTAFTVEDSFFSSKNNEIPMALVPLEDREICLAMAETIRAIVSESRFVIVRFLLDGPKGFNQLMRMSGINSKTLSATLKHLQDRGIVSREVISINPFTVRYSLSAPGKDLESILVAIENWGKKWLLKYQE